MLHNQTILITGGTADLPTQALRPAYTVLSSHALLKRLPAAVAPTPLAQTIQRLLAQQP